MIVTAQELVSDGERILERVINAGETVEVQNEGKTVAEIRPKTGASREELVSILKGRGLTDEDSVELRSAIDSASAVVGYAGCD